MMKLIVFFDTVDLSVDNVIQGICSIIIIIIIDLNKGQIPKQIHTSCFSKKQQIFSWHILM